MNGAKDLHTIRTNDIVVLPHRYIANPEIYASFQAYAFIQKMMEERDKLLEVLREARLSIALEDRNARPGQFTPLNCLRGVVKNCDDIQTEETK